MKHVGLITNPLDIATQSDALPAGGTTSQVLSKASNADNDVEWRTIPKITVGTTAPASPSAGDVWIDTN